MSFGFGLGADSIEQNSLLKTTLRRKKQSSRDFSGLATPDPIPNSAVKQLSPDDSKPFRLVKVGRRENLAFFYEIERCFFISFDFLRVFC